MALNLEYGTGTRDANSYADVAYVTAYLTELGRQTENSWNTISGSLKEAACIAATSYIDSRWGGQFKGNRQRYFSGSYAQAIFSFSGLPVEDETITIGNQAYKFRDTLQLLANDEVLIGADAAGTIDNLLAAITIAGEPGTDYSEDMLVNDAVGAILSDDVTDGILLTATQKGLGGNDIPISATAAATNYVLDSGFVNGAEEAPQALHFPRTNLYDRDGRSVIGIPLKLKQATAEYAVRAAGEELYQDPVVDDTGRATLSKKEKVGPIETDVTYEAGTSLSQLLKPYPAADQLLKDYILPGGRAFR